MAANDIPGGGDRLHSLAEVFTSSLDPKVILANLAARTSEILAATRCSIVLVEPSMRSAKARVFTAVDDPSIEGYQLDLESYPEIQVALECGGPIVVRDEPDDEIATRIRQRLRSLPFPLSVALPITYREERFGVLFLRFADRDHPLSEEALAFSQLIAFGAAVALHNSREYEEVLAEVRRQEHQAQQLAEANRLRVEILSSASHDLRAPLNSIIGYSDLLTEAAYGRLTEAQLEVVGYIASNAQSLLQLVNTVIDHARLETGHLPLHVSGGEVAGLFEELRITLQPLVRRRPIQLEFETRGALPLVETDWAKLKRVLLNLLHNSLKFTAAGAVTLTASIANGCVAFDVEDTGPGIPADDLPRIFDWYYRRNPDSTGGPGGLGLAIVKRYCELIGARVGVRSVVGQGTHFTVTVPVRWPKARPPGEPAV